LRKHWPDVPIYEDVRTLDTDRLGRIDLVCGGFPCQDISFAGFGEGLEGERSGLWREFYRIIGDIRPKYVIVENVAALLHRGMGRVLGDLAQIGFDAEWHCIPASYAGGTHIRDRVFIISYPHSPGLEGQQIVNFPAKNGQRNYEQLTRLLEDQRQLAIPTSTGGGIHDGVSKRMARLQALGNSVYVPLIEQIGKAIIEAER
tara:strand:+ start:165 stop:770 length:606 start_codon:yes stop_codon:yes gene_type:complete